MRSFMLFLAALWLGTLPARAQNLDPYVADAEAALQKLRGAMMQEMQTAMQKGVEQSIGVCRHAAPEIEARIGKETGWQVRRVALRVRNPANAANAEERGKLLSFEVRALGGQDPSILRSVDVVERDGKKWVHFMQAIPTFDMCLSCHGAKVTPKVDAAIRKLYPQDNAMGYKTGDIRGAFSLYKPYNPAQTLAPSGWARIAALKLPDAVALSGRAVPGNAQAGRDLFARHCRSCHGADDLAKRFFDAKTGKGEVKFCKKLETHGFTPEAQDCDILAFLKVLTAAPAAK